MPWSLFHVIIISSEHFHKSSLYSYIIHCYCPILMLCNMFIVSHQRQEENYSNSRALWQIQLQCHLVVCHRMIRTFQHKLYAISPRQENFSSRLHLIPCSFYSRTPKNQERKAIYFSSLATLFSRHFLLFEGSFNLHC